MTLNRKLMATIAIFVALTLVDTFIMDGPVTLKKILADAGFALLFLAGIYAGEWVQVRKKKKSMR